ncbi:MAG: hypothetical protein ABH951_02850 [Patescibacteria group bacterium]
MELSLERMATIITCMYGVNAEVVVDIWEEWKDGGFRYEREVECYLFTGLGKNRLQLFGEEIDCLIYNEIIELDSGCDEPGRESRVYVLTEVAQYRIQEIINNKREIKLLLKS